ncbi:hypothetical protein NQ315_010904 [Exocentrus adspersus]|uniref:Purine nucleoside phosphorylase n=1 Tax=Exocentrus adspersus TaxID=1586481 RepID=A0AAV8VNQ2_9CUCU|nr:hypothetical protein NQ315_010904 [Exocentrus adspersus]
MESLPKPDVRHILSQTTHCGYTYEDLLKTSDYIKKRVPYTPDVLIVFGSGLGSIADILQETILIEYKNIPNFPTSTVEGHAGKLVFGKLHDVNTVCMQGRFHYYEGYSLEECTIPIRTLALLGVKTLFVTNTGGAVNPAYKTGDIMFIKDHINFFGLAGNNPLRGANDLKFGPRFVPMNKGYDRGILSKAKEITKRMGLEKDVHEGVYALVGGPTYETVAEVNLLRTLGADAVGMSTVPEVIVGRHCGMSVFGFSLITNVCVSSYEEDRQPNHDEVLKAVTKRSEDLKKLLAELVVSIRSK